MLDFSWGPVRAFDGENEQSMQTLISYDSNLEKMFYRALHELKRLQGARLGQSVMRPIAIDQTMEGSKGPEEREFVL